MSPSLPTCASLAECRRHDGERIAAVGVYTVHDPYPVRKRDADLPLLARLAMDDTAEGPFLGAFWDAAAGRPEEERARLAGKRVRVVGTFHAQQPERPGGSEDEAAFGGPCLQPVESVREEP
ncbi:MAG TPA: hypothetical protein VFX98_02730 [Longimicrobiaceae bacterium]|nr:hypothetical protein [Longimicrobiaceae bacterium]